MSSCVDKPVEEIGVAVLPEISVDPELGGLFLSNVLRWAVEHFDNVELVQLEGGEE